MTLVKAALRSLEVRVGFNGEILYTGLILSI